MQARQRKPEEEKSQLWYPNTSKTILHISTHTYGFGCRAPAATTHARTSPFCLLLAGAFFFFGPC